MATPTSSRSAEYILPTRKPKAPLVMPTPRPPQHPFDQIHGVDTSGLIAAGNLITGHPNDTHVTAYYGVAPSILRTLIGLWRAPPPPPPPPPPPLLHLRARQGPPLPLARQVPSHPALRL